MKDFVRCCLLIFLAGCQSASDKHFNASQGIHLGDSQSEVLAKLVPIEKKMSSTTGETRTPDKYMKDGQAIEVYYFRNGRWTGITAPDESYTPYAFTDGILTSIGWEALGGPRTLAGEDRIKVEVQ